jgi:flagellar basal-body rod modification protein FlgD
MQIVPDISGWRAAAAGSPQTQDAGSPNGNGSSTASTATVTANDFLQLLVAEMKNQDPTTNTDPTQYIDQLVQVNSLEQLVQINQDLGGGSTPSGSASGASAAEMSSVATSRPSRAFPEGNLSEGNAGGPAGAARRVAESLAPQRSSATAADRREGSGNPFDAISAAMRGHAAASSATTISPAR